jgi:hypothetical protein
MGDPNNYKFTQRPLHKSRKCIHFKIQTNTKPDKSSSTLIHSNLCGHVVCPGAPSVQPDELVEYAEGKHSSYVVSAHGVTAEDIEKVVSEGKHQLEVGLAKLGLFGQLKTCGPDGIVIAAATAAAPDAQVVEQAAVEVGADALGRRA